MTTTAFLSSVLAEKRSKGRVSMARAQERPWYVLDADLILAVGAQAWQSWTASWVANRKHTHSEVHTATLR
jgi:hypothetical protein